MRILFLVGLLLLAACTQQPAVTCESPYILVGDSCCLDTDGNGVCDEDEQECLQECPELDCTKCPAQVIERNVTTTVTKYICEKTGEVVDSIEICRGANLAEQYDPIKTNQNGTAIEAFTVREACRDGFNAVEIHFVGEYEPAPLIIEVKDSANATYEEVFRFEQNKKEDYLYGVFCATQCTGLADFFLDPDKAYLLRGRFDFRDTVGRIQLSNEHIIDATEESSFMTKIC